MNDLVIVQDLSSLSSVVGQTMLTMSCLMRDDVESLGYVVGNAYCLDILDWI